MSGQQSPYLGAGGAVFAPPAPTSAPSKASTFATIWNNIGPIQSVLFAIAGGVWSAIQQHGLPTTLPGWCAIVGPALVAVGALHTTAPRHQNP